MISLQGTVGQVLTVPIVEDVLETGNTIFDYTILAITDSVMFDQDDDLEVSLVEVNNVSAPGYYELNLTPIAAGLLYLKVSRGLAVFEFAIQVSHAEVVADPSLEGDYEVTVTSGSKPVAGATVRVFDSTGTTLIARGLSNLLGKAEFPLPAGQYQVRINKDGHDFSAISPSLITVFPNDNVTPRIDEILPSSASIGDVIAVKGQFFHEDETYVVFGTEATVAADSISTSLDVVLVEVPAGLTQIAIPLRIRKPDPDNIGQYLYSNVLTLTRIP